MAGRGMHGSGGMHGREHAWQGGMCGGVCVAGRCAWQGACVAGGVHDREHAWQGVGAFLAGETAIAVGCTHPTGMHSC